MGNNKTLSEYIVECLIEGGIKQSSSERQERAFVEAINKQIVSINDPITVVFDNKIISGVTGVEKVEGLAPYGKEPYTDVVLKTTSGNINISMKGEHAPSLMGAGAAGIERLVPGWLKTLTPAIVKRMIDSGFKEGDFFSNKNKDVSGMVRKALEKYGGSGDINVYFAGYSDGRVYLANDGEMPPYIGNVSIKESGDGVRITSHIDNPDDTRGVPDMFFKIGERHIKTLFAGTKEMGGPIDMIYVGPMNVSTRWDVDGRMLIVDRTSVFNVESFIKHHPDIFLRVRKRRVDQPFAPNETHHILGSAIFGRGVFSGESSARVVVAGKLSAKAEYGGEI